MAEIRRRRQPRVATRGERPGRGYDYPMSVRRRRVRSITVCVGVFLLLGAVVNVAVAWGCAFQAPGDLRLIEAKSFELDMGEFWELYRERLFGRERFLSWQVSMSVFRLKPYTRDVLPKELPIVPPWTRLPLVPPGTVDGDRFDATGWPALCFCAQLHYDRGVGSFRTSPASGGISLPIEMAVDYPFSTDRVTLPLRPMWPGFAINTVFYAAILWLLFAAPGRVRRWRRIRRGLCAKCAYPVGTSDVCTECGAGSLQVEGLHVRSRGLRSLIAPPEMVRVSAIDPAGVVVWCG